jgi:2-polyprenyl-3-methyl-5-hydroxy-6-metoxy-1,4-benzoquinol methylase
MDSKAKDILSGLIAEYPADLQPLQVMDLDRIVFHVDLVLAEGATSVCDIGGGIGLFSLGCAVSGLKVTLVDDFRDPVNLHYGDGILQLHRSHGVNVVCRDFIAQGLSDFAAGSFDAITTFESMEHWHHSPKRLFHQVMKLLKPNGTLVIGVPNCVNLRKRITVPFGHGKWSAMSAWYEPDAFRGHVREADADDLRYIARDLGLRDARIIGRNWQGHQSPSRWIRRATRLIDQFIRPIPPLCSFLYLIGHKP